MSKGKFWFLLTIFVVSVVAVEPNVMILKLHYDNNEITLLNSTIKYGYYPDRRYEPEYGYRAEIISVRGGQLYEFRFKAPNELYVDGTNDKGELIGGKIVLDDVIFALTIPYFEDAKEIRIYSPEDKLVGVLPIKQKIQFPGYLYWVIGIIVLLVIGVIFFKMSKFSIRS